MGKPIEELKIISCHMGNGSSICAIENGKSVDTSMGFTPLVGLPMGTRCGDLDAGVIQFIMNKYGYTIDEMLNILNKKSGVLGVSGVSSDFRDLDKAAGEGIDKAKLALDMFNYWVAKVAGSYAAAMNGVDAIVFTAGVGDQLQARRGRDDLHARFQGQGLRHPHERRARHRARHPRHRRRLSNLTKRTGRASALPDSLCFLCGKNAEAAL